MLAAKSQNIQALNMDTSMNPLMAAAAAKRAKKDKANAAKRKLLPTEDAPGGLLIVHTPEPTDAFPSHRAASSQPTQLSQSKPPSKKFRAESQPPAGPSSRSGKPPPPSSQSRKPSTSSRLLEDDEAISHSDADVERDVRAMEDEADRLRRQSRARALLDQSLLAPTPTSSQSNTGDNNNNSMFNFPPPSATKSKPKPQFQPPSSSSKSKANAPGRGRTKLAMTPMAMEVDTQVPIPQNETPQQQRNKRLREGAMAAIREEQEADEERGRGRVGGQGQGQREGSRRRASSLSRGKRISTSYQQTGVITQPHNTVSEASFYKHIDADLPEVERIRQLLIWCAMRASSTYNRPPLPPSNPLANPFGPSASSSSSNPNSQPPTASTSSTAKPDPLPPLSAKAQAILKKSQDQFVKMLAEKQIDLSVQRPAAVDAESRDLKENEQNVRNRGWEVTYSADIGRAQAEEEAWKKVSYEYDAYGKKLQASLEKRKKALEALRAPRPPPTSLSSTSSGKGKGKGKARASTGAGGEDDVDMDDNEDRDPEEREKEDEEDEEAAEKATEAWLSIFPQPHELPPDFQRGADLARSILLRSVRRPPSNARKRKSLLPRASLSSLSSLPTSVPSESEDLEQTLLSALPTLQFKLDLLHTHLNAARATTAVCERLLDERYRVLNRVLDARMHSSSSAMVPPGGEGAGVGVTKTSVLTRYITPRARSPSSASAHARSLYPSSVTPVPGRSHSSLPPPPPPPPLPSSSHHLPDPHTLLRALTRVDAARPPAQVSDAARRAAREVQRVEESGVGAVAGDRRVTLLPGMAGGVGAGGVPMTPRKGTFGGGATPRRTPGRERTPGR